LCYGSGKEKSQEVVLGLVDWQQQLAAKRSKPSVASFMLRQPAREELEGRKVSTGEYPLLELGRPKSDISSLPTFRIICCYVRRIVCSVRFLVTFAIVRSEHILFSYVSMAIELSST